MLWHEIVPSICNFKHITAQVNLKTLFEWNYQNVTLSNIPTVSYYTISRVTLPGIVAYFLSRYEISHKVDMFII